MATNGSIDIYVYQCHNKGLLLPIINEYTWSVPLRAILYFIGMLWCFLAVAIISDVFMCSIERITSKTKKIKVINPDIKDGYHELEVKVWNDTVANLSLMALGTSGPEILLSVIETIGNGFNSGELGPGTIVGSAAFNLLIITGICIVSIPEGETRRVKSVKVFGVTSFFSLFAYIWLIVVLLVESPGEVDLWEAIVTFMFFPLLIILAYAADKDIFTKRNKTSHSVEIGLDVELSRNRKSIAAGHADIIEIAREIKKNTDLSEENAAKIVAAKMTGAQSHSSAWYRIHATRKLTGGQRLVPKINKIFQDLYDSVHTASTDVTSKSIGSLYDFTDEGKKAVVEFTAASCSVMENDGQVRIGVRRFGLTENPVSVRIETIDGTAEAGSDYKPLNQILTFAPTETHKELFIEIVDDDIWEPDEFFFVKMIKVDDSSNVVIGKISINQVTIINDDEPGEFVFSNASYVVKESEQKVQLTVNRSNGADGQVNVSWRTKDMTALNGRDYVGGFGKLVFEHGETSKILEVVIYDTKANARDNNFQLDLYNPTVGCTLGKLSRTIVTIVSDDEFHGLVSRIAMLTEKNLDTLGFESSTWVDQMKQAMNVNGGDIENASFLDYILHFISFFWKVLFSFVPPPSLGGGWPTFAVSLSVIGLLTTLIADLAKTFGCFIGIPDAINAIIFVALGTSMPDTFASRQAALQEVYADSAIGNINGSNSVNVFLGLGLPWLMATIYKGIMKTGPFKVPVNGLGFSVVLYTVTAVLATCLLLLRRYLPAFGNAELGGPKKTKLISSAFLCLLWILYVTFSVLQVSGVITVNIGIK